MTFSTQTAAEIAQIEAHLATHPYLSQGPLPSAADAQIFLTLKGAPDRNLYPNFYYWFLFISMFNSAIINQWAGVKAPKVEAPKATKKVEVPVAKVEVPKPAEEEIDLFGSEPAKQEKKPEVKPVAAKKEKKKVIAKSILVFDVKIFDSETNLEELAQKVYTITLDGLVWNREHKILDVAFGIKKLQIGCVIEDDKILTEDIFDIIQGWEEVQSTDVVTMQKV